MRKTLYIICISVFCLSCVKKDMYPDNCNGYSAGIYKGGFAYAEGSYQDFGENATFVRSRIADTINGGWKYDDVEKGFIFSTIDEYCSERMHIIVSNINIKVLDTIAIHYSKEAKDYPTAIAAVVDVDAIIESYQLIEDASNWLLITKVNADTSVVEGMFELSFVTSNEHYLSGEKERWDDPNRPDSLHYTNGHFQAVFRDY